MSLSTYQSLSIAEYGYELPESAIAKYPLTERDSSRLLQWKEGVITHHSFSDLSLLIPSGSLLVFNNTRVIQARLHFVKSTGARIEIFCLEPIHPSDYAQSLGAQSSCRWKCLVGNLKRWKEGPLELTVLPEAAESDVSDAVSADVPGKGKNSGLKLCASCLGEIDGGFDIEFSWDNDHYCFSEVLELAGKIPIPPYLNREAEEIDFSVYQTVYGKIKGSVAAPTAGLHFTDPLLDKLSAKGIGMDEVTLHVGAGTFQPVKGEKLGEHAMHTEHFVVNRSTLTHLLNHPEEVIAVGTTSVRTLESIYWIGCQLMKRDVGPVELHVDQWEPYREERVLPDVGEAIQAILKWMERHRLQQLHAATQIMILPGYRFRIIKGLVTNFHQPHSTLLLLIAAILGEAWKEVYQTALSSGYRFLSYGDANLYWIPSGS